MGSSSRVSISSLLELTEEDFQRGYVGSRPPELFLSPSLERVATPTAPPPTRASLAGPLLTALTVIAVASAAGFTYFEARSSSTTTVIGMEAAQPRISEAEPTPPPPKPQRTEPVVAPAVVPTAAPKPTAVPVAMKPTSATAKPAPAKPASPPPAAEAPPTTAEAPPPATYGVDQAGF